MHTAIKKTRKRHCQGLLLEVVPSLSLTTKGSSWVQLAEKIAKPFTSQATHHPSLSSAKPLTSQASHQPSLSSAKPLISQASHQPSLSPAKPLIS